MVIVEIGGSEAFGDQQPGLGVAGLAGDGRSPSYWSSRQAVEITVVVPAGSGGVTAQQVSDFREGSHRREVGLNLKVPGHCLEQPTEHRAVVDTGEESADRLLSRNELQHVFRKGHIVCELCCSDSIECGPLRRKHLLKLRSDAKYLHYTDASQLRCNAVE